MAIPENMVEKFRELYRARFNDEIDKETATRLGTNLLELVSAIYKPIKFSDLKQ